MLRTAMQVYFSPEHTHTTKMASVSQTWCQSYHSGQMPTLSHRVWFLMPTSFSQPMRSSSLSQKSYFHSPNPSPLPNEEMPENCDLSFMTEIKYHFFVKFPLAHHYFLLCTISIPYTYSYNCMHYTMLFIGSHLCPLPE